MLYFPIPTFLDSLHLNFTYFWQQIKSVLSTLREIVQIIHIKADAGLCQEKLKAR